MKPVISTLAAFVWLVGCVQAPSVSTAEQALYADQLSELVASEDRRVPIRVITPTSCQEAVCPLIVFSHGAFAAYDRYDALLHPLAEAGFQIVAPNHVDSEDHPQRTDYGPAQSMGLRLEDVGLITREYPADQTIALGHSYGALIAQFTGGAQHGDPETQARIDALDRVDLVVAISPPGPLEGVMEAEQWRHITTPMLVVTGTEDIVPGFADDWRLHLVSFDAAEQSEAFALVYEDIDHYFNGMFGRERDPETDNEAAMRARAMTHLNTSITTFIRHFTTSTEPAETPWSGQATEFVTLHRNTERTEQ